MKQKVTRFALTLLLSVLTATTAWADAPSLPKPGDSWDATTKTLTVNTAEVAQGAYMNNSVIENVIISNSVTSIGDGAFYNCTNLKTVFIGNGVTSIGFQAFLGCTNLKTVIMTRTSLAPSLSGNPFANTPNLKIYVPMDNNGNILQVYSTCSWYNYYRNYIIGSWMSGTCAAGLKDGVLTVVGFGAFENCIGYNSRSNITSIVIEEGVTSIGDGAFRYCVNLATITVDEDNQAFDSPKGSNAIIRKADNTLILGCKTTVIPASVTSIGYSAFSGCTNLTSITISASVTSIGTDAFIRCSNLESVHIGSGVSSIAISAFNDCDKLATITVDANNQTFDSPEGSNAIIRKADNTLVAGCKTTVIPNSVTSIGDQAFWGNDGLTSITIPNSVTSIGISAFYWCKGLTSITIPNSVTSIGDGAFNSCSNLASVTLNGVATIGENAFETGTTVTIAEGLILYNGTELLSGAITDMSKLNGKTLQRCYSITLPDHVTASGTAGVLNNIIYALPNATVTISAATGYIISDIAVNGSPLIGTSFTMPGEDVTVTILPSTVIVNVTGNGTVTYNDKVATNGEVIGVVAEKGTDVTLTLTPGNGYAVSIEYGYTNSNKTTISKRKLPISGTTATLTVPDNLKDGTYVTMTVSFVSALAGGADEASAVALTDNTVTNFAGGWYKVDSNITFDHTLNLLADTYLTIAKGKTMTVNTATDRGIDSDYTLTVSGAGALNVTTNDNEGVAVRVGNYVQTGATVTASGRIGIRCEDDFIGFDFDNDFTFSGGQLTATGSGGDGIDADNDITLSCTNATDFIQASSYRSKFGAVKVADGKALTDGTEASNGMNGYSGTLTDEQRTTIGGKTLRRAVITSYVEASGTLHENVIAIPLDNTMTTLAAGWYVVNSDVAYTGNVTLSGDVKLILGDGKTMTVTNTGTDVKDRAIYGDEKTLHIYGQSQGTGALTATAVGGDAAIFLETSHDNAGSLLGIHGGVVFASTECASGVAISVQCATDAGGIVIDGGQVTASGNNFGIYCQGGHFDILGGQVTATGTNIGGLGICDCSLNPGVLTLGYSKATDFVSTNSIYNYSGEGEVKIATDQTLVDGNGNIWSGTLSNDEIQSIRNQTLRPVTGVTLTKEYNNVSATFDGTSETTLSIPVDVNVTSVTYERTFTEGKPSTVMLPFNKAVSEIGGGTFYTFGGVEKKNNKWVATMNEVTGSLTANTPYLFVPTGTSLTFTGGATLNTTGGGNCLASDAVGWVFHGTYSKKLWNEVETHDYGFAATSGTSADNKSVEAGQFVRLTTGASAKPMRCYLSYVGGPNQARALTRGAAATDEELPSSIIVRLVGANGETTAIGTIDTKTGEMTFDSEAWYTLDGVRLSGKPTKKGLYINNGKKIVIK